MQRPRMRFTARRMIALVAVAGVMISSVVYRLSEKYERTAAHPWFPVARTPQNRPSFR